MAGEIMFLGGTETVTGSKFLVTWEGRRVMVDCGLFQGLRDLRRRNWDPMPVDPSSIHAVILTHAHVDHSGYVPLLVRNGYAGRVYCTQATFDLCAILLPDSGYLQEEEARYAERHSYSRHHPPLPLYSEEDGRRALERFTPVGFGRAVDLGRGLEATLYPAGHILGAAMALLTAPGFSLLFSGDLGRPRDPIMHPPHALPGADHLVLESTYGNRKHAAEPPAETLARIVNRTAARRGVVIIPAFAVGRAQALLYHVHRLKLAGAIPDLPVYLNSPMALAATDAFCRHHSLHRLGAEECRSMYDGVRMVRTVEESKTINAMGGPMIIISASGMATGGRVLHHLKAFAPDPRNTILFAGFQAAGTRGEAMVNGAEAIKIHGEYVPIRAEVASIDTMSAHADADEILEWLRPARPPRETFIVHGEPAAAAALKERVEREMGWKCRVPAYLEQAKLG